MDLMKKNSKSLYQHWVNESFPILAEGIGDVMHNKDVEGVPILILVNKKV